MAQNTLLLNYKIIGEGYPVVFLHGFLENNDMWEEILPELPGVKAICIELPGHGNSPLLTEKLSLKSIADAVSKILTFLRVTPFSVVGHSLGGYVALHLVSDSLLNIEHLVLLHSQPWADDAIKKENRNRAAKIVAYNKSLFLKEALPNLYYQKTVEKHQTKVQHLIESASKMSTEAIQETLFAMRDREDKSAILKKLGKNIHIIQGEFDHLIEATTMENAAKAYNNNFYLIQGIGHMGHHEAKEEVIQQLSFLQAQ